MDAHDLSGRAIAKTMPRIRHQTFLQLVVPSPSSSTADESGACTGEAM